MQVSKKYHFSSTKIFLQLFVNQFPVCGEILRPKQISWSEVTAPIKEPLSSEGRLTAPGRHWTNATLGLEIFEGRINNPSTGEQGHLSCLLVPSEELSVLSLLVFTTVMESGEGDNMCCTY